MSETSPTNSPIVIDANLAIRAVVALPVEVNTVHLFRQWRQAGVELAAPTLWLAECVSAIRRYVHARQMSESDGLVALDDLFALEVQVFAPDNQQCRAAFQWSGHLGQARAYDGFYLALAERLGSTFWTVDRRLVNAAQRAGIAWVQSVT